MGETCRLLKKSFYEDEWKLKYSGAGIWIRVKDNLTLWDNGFFFFTGYENGIHIPLLLRPYMKYHLVRGQNILATNKLLKVEQ